MGFWSWVMGGNASGVTPNGNPGPAYNPGDPDMVDVSSFTDLPESRALPLLRPSPWSGYPESWATPGWETSHQTKSLVDVAWACIDLNSSVLSSMPVYRLRNGSVISSLSWMANPDPTVYASWQEFAKQLFWDYHLGEAFVLPMAHDSEGYPIRFRVIPPWLIQVEMNGGQREYTLGAMDVTNEILHIRYQTTIDDPRGHGPLDSATDRAVTIGLLQRYTQNLAETGGVPLYWLSIDRKISQSEATDLMDRWIESRTRYAGQPALVSNGAMLHQAKQMNASEISLLEMTQFAEARIAILLGVPPFLVGLPGATGSLTYSNIEQLFGFHDRSSLRPKANAVMSALSGWALPEMQSLEMNRDDYTRPSLVDRANSYKTLIEAGVMTPDEARAMERLSGEPAAARLTGGLD